MGSLTYDTQHRADIVANDKLFVWHPYTAMDHYIEGVEPVVVARTQGSRLFDLDGRSYIDGTSAWWVAPLGHQHPRLLAALNAQAEKFCHVAFAGITHEAGAELAKELCAVAPRGLSKVFYSDNGSTAVELALKMCLQYWAQNGQPRRRRFLALSDAFHGETLGVTAIGGVEAFRRPFASVLMDCVHVPVDLDAAGYEHTFTSICEHVRKYAHELAAVVVEPLIQGAGGMRVYSSELLRELRKVTAELDVFLVADEVFTGYGRTGTMWACDQAGITPDVMCVAKGFTAGLLPMAATLTTERMFDGFRGGPERALYYGHTYCGHPLGAAVAREVLRVYTDEAIIQHSVPKAQRIARAIQAMAQIPGVGRPRSLGMMGAVQLGAKSDYLQSRGKLVAQRALEQGVYLRPLGNVVYVAPPLNIDDADLSTLLEVTHAAVADVAAQ
jgi:adenosylmethionine---8-amino-7-oxononanoate aminotransferase